MKRFICATIALVLMIAFACPVFAAEDTFVPSISVKGAPAFVADENGNIGVIKNADGEIISYISGDCLRIFAVAEAVKGASNADDLLLSVYEKLLDGSMTMPAEKLDAHLEADEVVIRDLVDISWLCKECEALVAEEGVVFSITLNLGVAADMPVYVMNYKNGEWNPIVSYVNNNDGTVTCTFEDLCPVSFMYGEDLDTPDTGAFDMSTVVWTTVLMVSVAALVVVLMARRKETV